MRYFQTIPPFSREEELVVVYFVAVLNGHISEAEHGR